MNRIQSSKEKALRINLDSSIYGSFAEIGAGQEVASLFFKAGGASGTIAKTMSAYDMKFSDSIYGPTASGRYVCEPRLKQMLDHEYGLLQERLGHRKETTCFFAFANTSVAINYHKTNPGHGWLGVRFQLRPETAPNDVVIHVRLHQEDTLLQHQAFGKIGVNLLYACFYLHKDPDDFINSLVDNMVKGDAEVDMIRFRGPDFTHIDNRLMSLKLVKNGLTDASLFGPDGEVYQPSETLYKKHIMVLRGRFRPVTHVNLDMFDKGLEQFLEEPDVDSAQVFPLMELTLNNLRAEGSEIDDKDFLDRVDILCSLGKHVLISNFREYFRLAEFFSQYTKGKIGIVLGVFNLQNIFDEKYYANLKGGILESFSSLFSRNVKLFVYPAIKMDGSGEMYSCQNFVAGQTLVHLFNYLASAGKLEDLSITDTKYLNIISDNVLKMIKDHETGWEEMVPPQVALTIKVYKLFGYTPPRDASSESQVQ